jgi:predicted AlkP superfamily pyrophosphatase or phosphodiesterase
MNKVKNIGIIFSFVTFLSLSASFPKLTVVIIIDQLPYQKLLSLKPFLKGGLATLLERGIIYEKALFPHAAPATGPGHAGIATGALPCNHGITNNKWIYKGKVIGCEDDDKARAAVFAPDGLYQYGKSSHLLMVDTLADQLMLQSHPEAQNKVFSLSLKSRSAIMLAGKGGKAIWFDADGNQFTSSKAYFATLPHWLRDFNRSHNFNKPIVWHPSYPSNHSAYSCSREYNYEGARKEQLYGKEVPRDRCQESPFMQQMIFDCAKHCLQYEFHEKLNRFLLYISISGTDKVGHNFGPESIEYVDLLYHIDQQLGDFMEHIYRYIHPQNVLWVLTSDHGVMPMVEVLQKKGYSSAQRIQAQKLAAIVNQDIEKRFGIADIVQLINMPDVHLRTEKYAHLSHKEKSRLLFAIKQLFEQQPGIKKAWLPHELQKRSFHHDEFEYYFQQQIFKGRSGDILLQVYPYVLINKNKKGTAHQTPYHYDTHVPLILYQHQMMERKRISTKVWVPSIAPTLSRLLGISAPSAAMFDLLPGIL